MAERSRSQMKEGLGSHMKNSCLYLKDKRKPLKFPQAGVYVTRGDLCSVKVT